MIKLLGFTIFSLLLFSFSFSQQIEELFKEYKEASELYRKTRKESLGHLILFTREDLDRMQAYRLSDVLKAIRFFTLSSNRFGILTLNGYGDVSPIPRHIRLYINDHEVSSLHTGSPFLVWENFPLDSVDHIEIYYGIGAIELGNDPATLIIKVYTKEPEKENASTIRTSVSSRKGYDGILYSGRELSSGLSYLFMISTGYDNRAEPVLNGQRLSRDGRYRFAFFGLYSDNASFELGYGFMRKDPFMGFALDNVAEKGYTRAEDLYAVLTVRPEGDPTMKLVLSVDNHRRKHYERSEGGLFIPVFMDYLNPLNNPVSFYENTFFNKVELYASKEFTGERNKLLTAVSYKLYSSDVDSRYYEKLGGGIEIAGSVVPFDRQEVYSLIIEDKFSLNPKNLLIGGIKLDKYYRNGGFKDFDEFIARLGYISLLGKNLTLKGFVSRSYIPPYFYDTEISGRDLDTTKIPFSASVEAILKLGSSKLSAGGSYTKIRDMLIPDSQGILMNSPNPMEVKAFFLALESLLLEKHKLQAGYSLLLDPKQKLSPTYGGYFRLLSTLGSFDAFTELVYRGSFRFRGKRIREGYDLNAGVSYHLREGLLVKLKGENLLNDSSETPYYVPASSQVVSYPFRDRTLYLTVEWVF